MQSLEVSGVLRPL